MDESLDVRSEATKQEVEAWEEKVVAKHRGGCVNCGSKYRLAVRQIIPTDAGGRLVESNGVLVCRRCEMAAQSFLNAAQSDSRRPINFLVSRALYDTLQEGLKASHGFKSMGSLIRYLITLYVEDVNRFDDLEQYQDDGSDVKINIWIDIDVYNDFKDKVSARGLSVTDAIKGLIQMYEMEARPLVSRRIS